MSATVLDVAAGAVLDASWRALPVIAVSALGARLAPSASARHAILAAGFAAVGCLPALSWWRHGAAIAVDAGVWPVLWLDGAAIALLPLAVGLARLARLRRGADGAGLVRYADVAGPLTFGAVSPVVLLPRAARGWTPERRRAVLLHELSHVRRRDWLVHVGAWLVCAALWFCLPLWWARARLADAAEHACDDAALRAGIRPSDYATALLSLARPAAPALGAGGDLGHRVRAVLAPARRRDGRRGAWTLAAAVALGALTASLLGITLWSASPALECREPATPLVYVEIP